MARKTTGGRENQCSDEEGRAGLGALFSFHELFDVIELK